MKGRREGSAESSSKRRTTAMRTQLADINEHQDCHGANGSRVERTLKGYANHQESFRQALRTCRRGNLEELRPLTPWPCRLKLLVLCFSDQIKLGVAFQSRFGREICMILSSCVYDTNHLY